MEIERIESRVLLSAGQLDGSFGSVLPDIGPGVSVGQVGDFELAAVAVQSSGQAIVLGHDDLNDQLTLKRYLFNGQPDTGFGNQGEVDFTFGGVKSFGARILVQADGKILVLGSTRDSKQHDDMALARFTTAGLPDSTFGSRGVVTFDAGGTDDQFLTTGIAMSDGMILAGGSVESGGSSDFFVARLKSNGTFDTTFHSTGKRTIDFNSRFDSLAAMALLSNGKILLAGSSTGFANVLSLAQLTSTGSLDSTFSSDGEQTGSNLIPAAIFAQASGRFVVAGYDPSGQQIQLRRFNSDGGLSTSFGTNGVAKVDFDGVSSLDDAVEQSDGKFVVSGVDTIAENAPFVIRIDSTGQRDDTYDPQGLISAIEEPDSVVTRLAILSDDRVMVGVGTFKDQTPPSGESTLFRLDADFTITRDDGRLTIPGTNKADAISLAFNSTTGELNVTVNGVVSSWNPKKLKAIEIDANGGADVIHSAKNSGHTPFIDIDGGDGNDTIFGDATAEALDGGAGDDLIHGAGGDDTISGDDGNDTIFGENGNDSLDGGGGTNTIIGGAGDDTLVGGRGTNDMFGDAGTDLASYLNVDVDLNISLDNVANDGAAGAHDNVHTDIENVYGGAASDSITGDSADNFLYGLGGDDTIHGGAGNDTLKGGTQDHLFGEDGNDLLIDNDRHPDTLDGGPGTDTAKADAGIDHVVNCEMVVH